MSDFLTHYTACIILVGIGLFFVIMSYVAARAGRTGVPLVGGLLIAVGFLTSPLKWLALLGLIDYGWWLLPYVLISEHLQGKKFDRFFAEHGFAERKQDDTKLVRIFIPDREEELFHPYITRMLHPLNIPKMVFAVCADKDGNLFLAVDHCKKGSEIESLPFDDNRITVTGHTKEGKAMEVDISIVRNHFRKN